MKKQNKASDRSVKMEQQADKQGVAGPSLEALSDLTEQLSRLLSDDSPKREDHIVPASTIAKDTLLQILLQAQFGKNDELWKALNLSPDKTKMVA